MSASNPVTLRKALLVLVGAVLALIVAGFQTSPSIKLAVSAVAALILVATLIVIFRKANFSSPRLIYASPKQLAWIRIIVCLSAFILTIVDDLPAISQVPVEFQINNGFFSLLQALPGYLTLVSSPHLLAILQWITAIFLLLAMIGFQARLTLLLGGAGFFVMQAILRQYTYFFHSGLILIYLLFILAWTPCAAAWSIDRWLNPVKSKPSRQSVAFSIYACFIVISIVYLFCGLSKMRDSGLHWFNGDSIRYKFLQDALNPIFLDYPWKATLWLFQHHAPEFIYSIIGIGGVVVELGYFTVLFSRTARIVMPILAFGVHLGILIFQHILFLDFLMLQFIFLDAERLHAFVSRLFRMPASAENFRAAQDVDLARKPLSVIALVAMAVVTAASFLIWTYRISYYPASDWHMYSRVSPKAPIFYLRVIANLEDGRSVIVPHRDYSIAVMPNNMSTLGKAFRKPWGLDSFEKFLAAYVARRNRESAFGSPVASIDIQKWRWNYMVDPNDPHFGWMADHYLYDATTGRAERAAVLR